MAGCYFVRYYANCGLLDRGNVPVEYGSKITSPQYPLKELSYLKGLHSDISYKAMFNFDNSMPAYNSSAYAKLDFAMYSILFDTQGG
ncbi:MAG: hypothetical protein HUJ51_02675 [Eggerthellaceae bacterium]|nr:hypothetical protein [Eggerthellaceae bacterium]